MHIYFLQDSNHFDTWPTRYVLLLWLSILNSIPFSIGSLDSNFLGNTKSVSASHNRNEGVTIQVDGTKSDSTSHNRNEGVTIQVDGQSSKLRLVDTILSLCTSYLSDSGLVREAGAYCIGLLTLALLY